MFPKIIFLKTLFIMGWGVLFQGQVSGQVPQISAEADGLTLTPEVLWLPESSHAANYSLRVKGQNGAAFDLEFSGGTVPYLEAMGPDGELLEDGIYAFEMQVVPVYSPVALDAIRFARATGDATEVDAMRKAGTMPKSAEPIAGQFAIHQGEFAWANLNKTTGRNSGDKPGDPVENDDLIARDSGTNDADVKGRDILIGDDLIVRGSGCIGVDCVDGESFGFDTLRLKENNLRIKFEDTSTGNFPGNDWQITINDSIENGANKFSIEDVTSTRIPFTLEALAPNHSLYVDRAGRVGLGTSLPVTDLHMSRGDTPRMRLEQTASSGFQPQTWDIAANETNFMITDANGASIPFRIRPGAPNDSLMIHSNGSVGIGTFSPDTALDVDGGTKNTTVKVQSSQGIPQFFAKHSGTSNAIRREMFVLENHGEPSFRFSNTDPAAGDDWSMILLASDQFAISRNGSGVVEMLISNGGNVSIAGTLMQGSDVHSKENFEEVDPLEVLEQVAQLPISTWNYRREDSAIRHMGPMAQDFAAVFGLGADETRLATVDVDGVMLAAIQGLNLRLAENESLLEERARHIQVLEKRDLEISQNLQALTAALRVAELERRDLEAKLREVLAEK